MEREPVSLVFDKNGRRAILGDQVSDPKTGSAYTRVRLEDGRSMLVLSNLLIQREDGSFYLPVDLDALERQRQHWTEGTTEDAGSGNVTLNQASSTTVTQVNDGESFVVPVIEETVEVQKRTVERGVVRVHKHVTEHEEVLSDTLMRETVEVERVPINQIVQSTGGVRQEGDIVIIPVYEEVAVVEKRLMLKEEIRLHMQRASEEWSERVVLRNEEIEIERDDTMQNPDAVS